MMMSLEKTVYIFSIYIYIYILYPSPTYLPPAQCPTQTEVTGLTTYPSPPRSSGRTAVPATQAEEPRGESDIKGVLGENPHGAKGVYFEGKTHLLPDLERKLPHDSHQIQFGRKKSSPTMIQDGLKNTLRVGIHQQS